MSMGIILCEGRTDQSLLGNYLEKVAAWRQLRPETDKVFFEKKNPFVFAGNSILWYENEQKEYRGIWQVRGCDNFAKAIFRIFDRETKEHLIDSVVVLTDYDDESAAGDRLRGIKSAIGSALGKRLLAESLTANQWSMVEFNSDFANAVKVQVAYLLVPMDSFGTLETFIVDEIAKQSREQESVVEQSRTFIDEFKSECYLQKTREKIKAKLGVVISVIYPDRAFGTLDSLVKAVPWENCQMCEQFELLKKVY